MTGKEYQNPFRLTIVQAFCRYLPPILAQSLRAILYSQEAAYRDNYAFSVRAQTGSMFTGSTADFHGYRFGAHGYYNWRNLAIALASCNKGAAIIEIGGNVGTETVGFADIVGAQGQVIVFEPLPTNVRLLENLCAINRFAHVRVIPAAVSNQNGTIHFICPPDSHASGIGFITNDENILLPRKQISVETMRLNDVPLGEKKISAIFVDAEGSESAIFQGAAQVIRKHRPVIVCEASPKLLKRGGSSIEELQNIIAGYDYEIYEIGRFGLTVRKSPAKGDWACLPLETKEKAHDISAMLLRCGLMPCLSGLNPLTNAKSRK